MSGAAVCFTTALLLLYYCFTAALLLLYCCFTAAFVCRVDWRGCQERLSAVNVEVKSEGVIENVAPGVWEASFTAALLLLYCCFTAALLLLYCCFTAALLLLYCILVAEGRIH